MVKISSYEMPVPYFCPVNFFEPMADGSVSIVQTFSFDVPVEAYEITTLLANNVDLDTKVSFHQQVDIDSVSAIEDSINSISENLKVTTK